MGHLGQTTAWLLPFFLLVLALIAVPVLVMDDRGLPRYKALRAELKEYESANRELGVEVERLKQEIDALRADTDTVERIARDELGMVREGELIFQFPDAP